ncbi:hypothetical protein ESCOCP340M_26590 [Escherichia coli]
MSNIFLAGKYLHNLFDMGIGQDIVVGFFFEQFAGINKLNFGIRFMFRQHQNVYSNSGAKEQVRCQ